LQDNQQRPRQQNIRRHLWVQGARARIIAFTLHASSIGCVPAPYHHAQGLMGIDAAADTLRTTANVKHPVVNICEQGGSSHVHESHTV
jgi:hypothetical protein